MSDEDRQAASVDVSPENLQAASSVKLISFDRAEVRPGFVSGTYFLIVHGEAPCLNMDVRLSPVIYITCPDYWLIEVTGSLPGGFCLTGMKPYCVTIPLNGIIGYEGIEVRGDNRTEKFDVPGGCKKAGPQAEDA